MEDIFLFTYTFTHAHTRTQLTIHQDAPNRYRPTFCASSKDHEMPCSRLRSAGKKAPVADESSAHLQ